MPSMAGYPQKTLLSESMTVRRMEVFILEITMARWNLHE